MSDVCDAAVSALVLELENYLNENSMPDSDYLAEWNTEFSAAVASTERGSDWKSIVDRAHALNEIIQKQIGGLSYERDEIRKALSDQVQGQRALKGYSPAN